MNKALQNIISGITSVPMLFDKQCAMQVVSQFKTRYSMILEDSENAKIDPELIKELQYKFSIVGDTRSEVRTFTGQIEDDFSKIEKDSVAVIPIQGIMMRDDYCSMSEGFISGTRTLERLIAQIEATESITSVVFRVNTPGGQASGNESLARAISSMSKPAIVHFEMMASAGVAAFQVADEVWANESTSYWGSIGTMASWADDKAYWEEQGVTFHEVYAEQSTLKNIEGRAADDGDYDPMIDRLTRSNAKFIASVKKASPNLKDDGEVFKGKLYHAYEAQKIGAINGVKSLEEVIDRAKRLGRKKNNNSSNSNTKNMSNEKKGFFSGLAKAVGLMSETEKQQLGEELQVLESKESQLENSNKELKQELENATLQNTNITKELEAQKILLQESQKELAATATNLEEAKKQAEELQSANAKLEGDLAAAKEHAKKLAPLEENATPLDNVQSTTTEEPKALTKRERYERNLAASENKKNK